MSEFQPCPELNLNNYDEDDVAELNAWAIQAAERIEELEAALNNRPESEAEAFPSGVWFQAAASGLWYQNHKAAGSIASVNVDGVRFKDRPESEAERVLREWGEEMATTKYMAIGPKKLDAIALARKLAGETTKKGE